MAEQTFTVDWSQTRAYWPDMVKEYDWPTRPTTALEIGCFEGLTSVWILENILTHPDSRLHVIDTFTGSPEFDELGVDATNLWQRFTDNISPHRKRVDIHMGRSQDVLRQFDEALDFVYVDGSHTAVDVLTDAVLVWPLVKPGGVVVFDDYLWGMEGQSTYEQPKRGIDAFVTTFLNELEIRLSAYQFVVEKRSDLQN